MPSWIQPLSVISPATYALKACRELVGTTHPASTAEQLVSASIVDVMPELTFIKAGSLDDTSWLDPKMHVYCDSKQQWTPIPADSQTFAKMPG